jgi:hypothetical protein
MHLFLGAQCKKALMQEAGGSRAEGKKACTVSFLSFFNWIVISARLRSGIKIAIEMLCYLLESCSIQRYRYATNLLRFKIKINGAIALSSVILVSGDSVERSHSIATSSGQGI